MHVLIVGAGLTGLLIAHGLTKAGIPFSIFEAEPSATHYRPREWSMGLHWSLPLLHTLLPADLTARLKEAQNDPYYEPPNQDIMRIWGGDEKEGKVLAEIPIPKMIRYSRRKLRALCSQGIDIRYGSSLASIEYGAEDAEVTATFANGETATGSLIIGTDGPRSKVRDILLGADGDLTLFGAVQSNVAVVYHDAEKAKFVRRAHPVFSIAVSPSNVLSFMSIQDVQDPEDPANWRFQVFTSWEGKDDPNMNSSQRLAEIKAKAEHQPEPFRSAVLWIPEDTNVTYDSLAYWVSKDWDNHNGRATLAGDAAHPMTPHRGQGLNHAVCDASNFVTAMTKVKAGEIGLPEAITAYSEEAVKRGADEVVISKMQGEGLLDYERFMNSPFITKGINKNG